MRPCVDSIPNDIRRLGLGGLTQPWWFGRGNMVNICLNALLPKIVAHFCVPNPRNLWKIRSERLSFTTASIRSCRMSPWKRKIIRLRSCLFDQISKWLSSPKSSVDITYLVCWHGGPKWTKWTYGGQACAMQDVTRLLKKSWIRQLHICQLSCVLQRSDSPTLEPGSDFRCFVPVKP